MKEITNTVFIRVGAPGTYKDQILKGCHILKNQNTNISVDVN